MPPIICTGFMDFAAHDFNISKLGYCIANLSGPFPYKDNCTWKRLGGKSEVKSPTVICIAFDYSQGTSVIVIRTVKSISCLLS